MEYQFPDCLCGANQFARVFLYKSPPNGEVRFDFSYGNQYHREVKRCENCGHYVSVHHMDMSSLYDGEYMDSTYTDKDGIRRTFERIISLPSSESDNEGRVARVVRFAESHFSSDKWESVKPAVLDVGSGLCVFLYRLREHGFSCTALDTDERAVEHAKKVAGVNGVCADFFRADELGKFDIITFNKVLEHVRNPIRMLAKAGEHLTREGFVYIEVPDGEAAVTDGQNREEFFVEHHHIFSVTSLSLLITRAGFFSKCIERLREPSSKYTLRAFVTPKV